MRIQNSDPGVSHSSLGLAQMKHQISSKSFQWQRTKLPPTFWGNKHDWLTDSGAQNQNTGFYSLLWGYCGIPRTHVTGKSDLGAPDLIAYQEYSPNVLWTGIFVLRLHSISIFRCGTVDSWVKRECQDQQPAVCGDKDLRMQKFDSSQGSRFSVILSFNQPASAPVWGHSSAAEEIRENYF